MAEYTVVAPDGKELVIEGPAGASQADVIAQAQKLYQPTTVQNQTPQNQVINTDVPTVVSATPPTPVVEPQRSMMEKMKAIYEVPATIGSSMIAQPVGAGYAVYKALTSPQTGQAASAEGRAAGQQLSQAMTYQPTSPVTGEVLQGIGSALEASKIPPVIPSIGVLPSYARMAQGAVPQVKQELQAAKPIAQNMAQALRKEPSVIKTAPSAQELAQTSKNLFTTAKESGVELNAKDFATNMASIGKELRSEGYDPRLYPKLSVALDEMTQAGIPKDFQELSTLRKFIQGAQKSADPDERRLATILKDDFDNYVSNIPESSVVGGSKEGLAAWKEARNTYSRLSKSEVFTDMLENAQLDKSKFSMSGIENSLAQQLRQLAKNDKKMRLFTAEEQEAIKKAAKGGAGQNVLRFIGKFAPTSAVSSIPALLTTSVSGPLGLSLTAASMGARVGATQMRKADVNKLAAIMRAGAKKTQGATNE